MRPAEGRNKKVLLVEDNRLIREILTELLEGEGFAVQVANNGSEGLRALESEPAGFGVILLDWVMPLVSGLEFRRAQLRHPQWAHTPTLVLTADVHGAGKLAETRDTTLVEKPLQIGRLVQLVHASLGAQAPAIS